jgi:hypothetical protein
MSATAIQSDKDVIALTGLLDIIKNPNHCDEYRRNSLIVMDSLLTQISNDIERSSVSTSLALDIVTNKIARKKNKDIPKHLEDKREKLTRNLIRSTQREAAAAAAAAQAASSAAATNAARCSGIGCFSRLRNFSSRVTPMPPTSPIVSPYNPQPALAGPFRRTSRKTPPSLPGAVEDYSNRMPLGGSRRVRRLNRRGQRVKHRRRTIRRMF